MMGFSASALGRASNAPIMDRLQRFLLRVSARSDLAIVVMMVVAIAVMILPLPTPLIDLLIALNIGTSVMVLMVAVYLDRPTRFSTLPAVILISTLFRLATEVAVTRVVLVEADAGEIVRAFGDFVVSGNVVVGLVTFLIITVVQFIVITKGSERVAEVAARFTLDALPGKQMSIDSDLRGGDITKEDARRQRRQLGQESQLFGAMDGAMKFVKGDAITGLIIVLINLLGGIAVGCLQHGMAIGQAVQTYSLLTVGDGLVAQLPALLISFSAGTVVTRVATDDPRDLGSEIVAQMVGEPRAMIVAAAVLALLAFVPGFPAFVFLPLAAAAGGIAAYRFRRHAAGQQAAAEPAAPQPEAAAVVEDAVPSDGPIVLVLPPDLGGLERRHLVELLERSATALGQRFGLDLPAIAVRCDPDLDGRRIRIDIDGVPAVADRLAEAGPYDALAQLLERTLSRSLGHFMGIQEARRLLVQAEGEYADLVQEAQRIVPVQVIAEVFRSLVEERVALKPLRLILGALVTAGPREQDARVLAEHVRTALRRQISHDHAGADGLLPVLVVEREAEDLIRASVRQTPAGDYLALPEDARMQLLQDIRQALAETKRPAVLTSFDVRRLVRGLLVRHEIDLPVLSYQDLSSEISVQPIGSLNCVTRSTGNLPPFHVVGGMDDNPEAAE